MGLLYPQIIFKKKSIKNIALPPVTLLALQVEDKAINFLNRGWNIDTFRDTWIKDLTDRDFGEELAIQAVDLGIKWAREKFLSKSNNKKKADLEEKEIWQMTFLEFVNKKWGDNWMIGHKRLEEKEYHGKVGRQITEKDYRMGMQEYVQAVMQALSEGKPISAEVLTDFHVSQELKKQSSTIIGEIDLSRMPNEEIAKGINLSQKQMNIVTRIVKKRYGIAEVTPEQVKTEIANLIRKDAKGNLDYAS